MCHPVQGVSCPRRLGFVDLDLGSSTTLLGQYVATVAAHQPGELTNLSQPNPGLRGHGTPCTSCLVPNGGLGYKFTARCRMQAARTSDGSIPKNLNQPEMDSESMQCFMLKNPLLFMILWLKIGKKN